MNPLAIGIVLVCAAAFVAAVGSGPRVARLTANDIGIRIECPKHQTERCQRMIDAAKNEALK